MNKHVLAMGGGGFTSQPQNLKLDKYLLSISDKKTQKFVSFRPQVVMTRVTKDAFILHIKN